MPTATTRVAGALLLGLPIGAWLAARRSPARSLTDDELARDFHDARRELAPLLGVEHRATAWDDVPLDERLLTAAALRRISARGVISRR